MAVEPTLDVMTKVRLGAFAAEMAIKHPSQKSAILALQDTLEQRLPLDVQNKIIEKLNKDPKGTLAAAGKLIDQDPKVLDEVNKNPLKLATIMGVDAKPAAPAANQAPVTTAAATPAAAANAPATTTPAKPANATKPDAKSEPVVVVAAPSAPAKPASEQELSARAKLTEESAAITKMPGFEEFATRAEKSQSLTQAMNAMMGKDAQKPEDAAKALQDIRKDPDFFVKANKAIDEIPEQMRENVFTQIAENPKLGRDALAGDADAKSKLTMSSMMGGLFGGGKGGFDMGALGKGMMDKGQGFLGMLGSLLPSLLNGLMEFLGKGLKNITKMSSVPAITSYGNGDGVELRKFSRSVDNTLGTDSSQKPVFNANKPEQPAVAMSQLGQDKGPAAQPTQPVPGTPELAQLDQKKIQGPQNPQIPGSTSFA